MLRKISIFLAHIVILYNLRDSIALVGQNVRSVHLHEYSVVVCFSQYAPGHPLNHSMLCSGSLVTSSHVLLSEHCLNELGNANALEAIIGNGDIVNGERAFAIWWISYDQWSIRTNNPSNTLFNDIAVLKLMVRQFSIPRGVLSQISPITLMDGMDVTVYGCGRTIHGTIPDMVQVAEVTVLKLQECIRLISHLQGHHLDLPVNYICTKSNPYVQVDRADSGGPLTFFGSIIGVTAGLCPSLNGVWNAEKVNVHVAIDYYRNFFDHILMV